MLMMFSTRVMTNSSSRPRTGCCTTIEPTGFSPPAVVGDEAGHRLHALARVEAEFFWRPAASVTIMVSPIARDMPEHDGGGDAGERGREDHAERGLHPVGAHRQRALAQRLRHRGEGVLGERGDGRDDHHAEHQAGGEGVGEADVEAEDVLQQGRRDEASARRSRRPPTARRRAARPSASGSCGPGARRTRRGTCAAPRPSGTATSSAMTVTIRVAVTSGMHGELAARWRRTRRTAPRRRSRSPGRISATMMPTVIATEMNADEPRGRP